MTNLHNSNQGNSSSHQQEDCQSYPSRKQILDDMEKIFILALEMGKINVALRAKELIGKELGFFLPPSKRSKVNDHKAHKTEQEIQVDFIQEEKPEDGKKSQQPLETSNTIKEQPHNSKTGGTVRSSILAVLLTGASLYSLSNSDLQAHDMPCKILGNPQKVLFKKS